MSSPLFDQTLADAIRAAGSSLRQFRSALTKAAKGVKHLSRRLQARTAPTTDEERFTMNLARRHADERDWTLVAEDYAWLGRRLEAAGW